MVQCHARWIVALCACTIVCVMPPATLSAAGWEAIPTFSGTIVIEPDTVGPPSTRLVGASGVWVRYIPSLSVDCSPPRGCYASSQRIYYNFGCAPRYAVVVERISMDLNGEVLKRETPGNYAAPSDEAANRILNRFCGVPERE